MYHHFGVAGGLENRPVLLKLSSQKMGVHEIPIVGQSNGAFIALDTDGLRIQQGRVAGG